jgi:hypothetical protein
LTGRVFDDVATAYAAVCYRLPGEPAFVELPLSDDGQQGDNHPNDGYYGAILPALPAGETLEYYLRVVDLEGQTDASPDNFTDPAALHRMTIPQPSPAIRLSELVAANDFGFQDESGDTEDWIELVNTSPLAVSLDGLALTKDYFDRTAAWPFPAGVTLAPGERVIVFCDEDLAQGPLHASFKLPASGDRVYLVRTDDAWTVLDAFIYGALPSDVSFGLVDFAAEPLPLVWPTPAQDNAGGFPPNPTGLVVLSPGLVPRQNPAFLGLRWLGATNATYRIQHSADLTAWNDAFSLPRHLGLGVFDWTDAAGLGPARFYRVVTVSVP